MRVVPVKVIARFLRTSRPDEFVVVVGADVVGWSRGVAATRLRGRRRRGRRARRRLVVFVVDVDGTVVDVLPVLLLIAALAPGCSSATTRPRRAVAPAAATIVAAVR